MNRTSALLNLKFGTTKLKK